MSLQKTDKKLIKNSSKYQETITRSLSDYLYHQKYYKLIGVGLSKQKNTSIFQQVNFKRRLENDGTIIFCITEKKSRKMILKFSLDSLNVTELYKQ